MDKSSRQGLKVPTVRAFWCYSFTLNKHRSVHMVYVLFLHFLPALIIDGVSMLLGKRPKYVS
jgi:fatty acyl-CoA reductase